MNEISKEQLLYMKRTRQHKQFVLFFQLFLFIFFIILWEITSRAGIINAFIFSSPSRMLASGKELLLNGQLLKHLGITLAETFASFFLVTAVSLFTAILLWWNNTLSEILEPYFVILKQPAKIRYGSYLYRMAWQQYENNYCNSDIRCHIRKYLKPFYKLYVYRPG